MDRLPKELHASTRRVQLPTLRTARIAHKDRIAAKPVAPASRAA
jgi:hypothetical protein